MPLEIERKFLLAEPPDQWPDDVLAKSAVEIRQAYLTDTHANPEVRLRAAREVTPESAHQAVPSSLIAQGGSVTAVFKLGIKGDVPTSDEAGVVRHEIEVDLDEDKFREAWALATQRTLRKVRISYTLRPVSAKPFAIAVDWFRDQLTGLVMAEIEFESWNASRAFIPPEYLGEEVTHLARYRNAELASALHPPRPPA